MKKQELLDDETRPSNGVARILIVDDHPTLCEGLAHCISAQPDMVACGDAATVEDAMQMIGALLPDAVIVDIALKNSDGLDLIKLIHSHYKDVRVIVHSMYEESLYADRCLHAGALGYVNKESDASCVIEAIRDVLAGRVYLSREMTSRLLGRRFKGTESSSDPTEILTDRQLEIFRLIGDGLSAPEIARRLHISVHTVETHRENIKRKLEAKSAADLIRKAVLWSSRNR